MFCGEANGSAGLVANGTLFQNNSYIFSISLVYIPSDKSSPDKVAAKLFILQAAAPATFFRPCLGGAQSIASRNVAS